MIQPKLSLKAQRRARTRRRLLDAALSLFASKGYEGTSIDDICTRTDLSKGAFYFHFAGKEALLAEALEETAAWGPVSPDFWSVGKGGGSGLRTKGYASGLGQGASISPALQLELWVQALRQERVWHHLRRSRTRFTAVLRRHLRHRLATGDTDVEALRRGIAVLRDGIVVQSLLFLDDPMEARLRALVAAFARRALDGEPFRQPWDMGQVKRPA